jgi:hypothetical protein
MLHGPCHAGFGELDTENPGDIGGTHSIKLSKMISIAHN